MVRPLCHTAESLRLRMCRSAPSEVFKTAFETRMPQTPSKDIERRFCSSTISYQELESLSRCRSEQEHCSTCKGDIHHSRVLNSETDRQLMVDQWEQSKPRSQRYIFCLHCERVSKKLKNTSDVTLTTRSLFKMEILPRKPWNEPKDYRCTREWICSSPLILYK